MFIYVPVHETKYCTIAKRIVHVHVYILYFATHHMTSNVTQSSDIMVLNMSPMINLPNIVYSRGARRRQSLLFKRQSTFLDRFLFSGQIFRKLQQAF